MTAAQRVLVVGDVMQDIVVRPEGPMRKGTDVPAAIRIVPGGSAANQAAWLVAESLHVTLCGRVGAADRDELVRGFAEAGVEAVLAADPEMQTGRLINLVDKDGERSFFTDRGANLGLNAADIPDDAMDAADLLVLSGYTFSAEATRDVAVGLLARARGRHLPVAVDPASAGFIADVGASQFLGWIAGADIVLSNREEAEILTGETDPERQLDALAAVFGTVVIKLGADGALARTGTSEPARVGSVETQPVDSTGAGDAFAAGFLAARLSGAGLEDALRAGNGAGARAVAHLGGRPVPHARVQGSGS